MAGRNHIPAHALNLREPPITRAPHPALIDDPRLLHRVPPSLAPPARPHQHPAALVVDGQHREIQTLLLDNQRLAATHVALKQELVAAQQEFRHLSRTADAVKAESDAQVIEVYERSLKMEADARSIEGLAAELAQVRTDVQKLSAEKKELIVRMQAIDVDLVRTRPELQHFPAIKAEIDAMHQEIQRGRAAVEYEKKTHANNLEISQAMDKHMKSMALEIEKLCGELANAEKRARAAAAAAAAATPNPGYPGGYGNPEMGYGGNSYPDPYAMHHQVQGGSDAGHQYGPGPASHSPYDMQRPHVHRS